MGSSRTSRAGSASSARASASRWRWPPDRAAPCAPTGVSQPRGSEAIQPSSRAPAAAAASSASLAPGRASRRLSRMVVSKMCGSWAQPLITARTSSGSYPARSRPFSRAVPAAEVDEPEQHRGHAWTCPRRSRRPARPAARRQGRDQYPNGRRLVRPVADRAAAGCEIRTGRCGGGNGPRPGSGPGPGRPAPSAIRPAAGPGVAERERGRGQRGDRLEGGQRGQRDHGQRHPAQRARTRWRPRRAAARPTGSGRRPRRSARCPGRTPTRSAGPAGSARRPRPAARARPVLDGAERVQFGGPGQQVGDGGAELAAGGRGRAGPPGGPTRRRPAGTSHARRPAARPRAPRPRAPG